MAYLSEARNSGPRASTYLGKIQTLATHVDSMGTWWGGWTAALAYDWTYSTMGATAQGNYRSRMYTMMTAFESAETGFSPYNDQFYITGSVQTPHLILALAIYPDDAATSRPHWNWSADMFLNYMMPVWRQVIGGGGGCSTGDSDTNHGGGWHEEWVYQNNLNTDLGMIHWFAPYGLAWMNAIGDSAFFTRECWFKNYSYYTMYMVRPDWRMDLIGQTAFGLPDGEFGTSGLQTPASLSLLGEIYDDPTIRGWARTFNRTGTPDGFEPSGWPWYAPDTNSKSTNTRSSLSKVRNFPGWGTIFFRNGWGEDNAFCWLRYGDNFWSHPVQDAGTWACFNRGELALRSGSYRVGTGADHQKIWLNSVISGNALTVTDSADTFTEETVQTNDPVNGLRDLVLPNEGGQRRVGSDVSNLGGEMQQATNVPLDLAMWNRSHELYQGGTLIAFVSKTAYTYAAVDITRTYNNPYSAGAHTTSRALRESNSINRTMRVSKVIRHLFFIPRPQGVWVVIYDQVTSVNTAFTKKNIVHFVNSPTVSSYSGGTKWTATRTETVTGISNGTDWPYPFISGNLGYITHNSGNFQYVYDGKTYGWMTLPVSGTITTIGGSGSEFKIGSTNYNNCLSTTYCASPEMSDALIVPNAANWTSGFGSYRFEQAPASAALEDWFLNLMLFTNSSDTNVPSTEPATTLTSGNFVTVFKENANKCTTTISLPKYGLGPVITRTETTGGDCTASGGVI
jgi:hypothetical protein